MNCDALLWNANMMANKSIVLRKSCNVTVVTKCFIRKLTAQGCVCKKIADAAFDIHPAVGTRSACCPTDFVKFFFFRKQMHGQRFQHKSSLLEGHFSQL